MDLFWTSDLVEHVSLGVCVCVC